MSQDNRETPGPNQDSLEALPTSGGYSQNDFNFFLAVELVLFQMQRSESCESYEANIIFNLTQYSYNNGLKLHERGAFLGK